MFSHNRRKLLQASGALVATGALSATTPAQAAAPRVVVIGGGFAGATVAKYVRMWNPAIQVSLVEPNPGHVSCILSNLVMTGAVGMSTITLRYDNLRSKYGVNIVADRAVSIDPVSRVVLTANGSRLPYDKLVLAPGIDFDSIPGLDSAVLPHAWQAGPQTLALKAQLDSVPAGGTFVMSIPKAPYRCPPGPYERACLLADSLLRRRRAGRVIVLDANSDVVAEPHTFHTAFQTTYAGVIDYRPNSEVLSVDWAGKKVVTNWESVPFDAANIIPPQRAGKLVAAAGLLGSDPATRWAPVNPLSYESRVVPNVHVIGDSQGTGQPKSGHMANAQAKVCADALVRYFAGEQPDPAPMTSSACYSPITATTASWLTVVFGYDAASGLMKPVANTLAEAPAPTAGHYKDMFGWAKNLFADSFS
ncbi:NAD(P)/FAD-dependent oxidoreductase [Zoogloea sp. G-4-1-14]|uniref:NAD(P)/FAD-dependent oxidoreductase n=2 Tax=Zoogloea dura TaxID=2728840 RepID=A0A848G7U2_9RHOO|nr:NAD(P)/FAD-dependent oxidoreductase [Zoogloea dura]